LSPGVWFSFYSILSLFYKLFLTHNIGIFSETSDEPPLD
jgi:hypothetical protein